MGAVHGPQPDTSSHLGFGTGGAIHSPSSASSHSSGLAALGSGTISGSSSSQSAGFLAAGSRIIKGASSSQSSGLLALGSGISASSTQSAGLVSSGSSISLGGLTAGEKSSSRWPLSTDSSFTRMSNVLSGLTMSVYSVETFDTLALGGSLRCFSSNTPVLGFLCRKIKCSLLSAPQRSGPNMIE